MRQGTSGGWGFPDQECPVSPYAKSIPDPFTSQDALFIRDVPLICALTWCFYYLFTLVGGRSAPGNGVERGGESLGDLIDFRLGDRERRRDLQRHAAQQPRDHASLADLGHQPGPDAWVGGAGILGDLDRCEQAGARAHLADEAVRGERPDLLREDRLELGDPPDQPLPLQDVQVGQPDRARGGVALVRVAVPEHLLRPL